MYFCLKNNQQTCEKQISGLKFCAEFMRNNGLRLERGWEDIGVLWIIFFFSLLKVGKWQFQRLRTGRLGHYGGNVVLRVETRSTVIAFWKKKKRGGRERVCEKVSCWRVVRWIGFLQLKHICFIECSQHYWSVFIVGPNALPEISAVTTAVHHLFSATFNTIFWGFRYLRRH